MSADNIPEIYQDKASQNRDLFAYDFKMTEDVVKSKVHLNMNMFSFLQVGTKQVHFADTSVMVNKNQSLLIKKGNLLWTELLDKENIYYCKLFFFSEDLLRQFLDTHGQLKNTTQDEIPYFIIENDDYISSFLNSLSIIDKIASTSANHLLSLKFEEIMLYLLTKYGEQFEKYLLSLISKESSSFKRIIESNVYSNLKLEEIAFLCNMSLSTFKRIFKAEYDASPGKWFQDHRLLRAKEVLEKGELSASEIYFDMGYGNLSNFSIAFKNKFGINPTEIPK